MLLLLLDEDRLLSHLYDFRPVCLNTSSTTMKGIPYTSLMRMSTNSEEELRALRKKERDYPKLFRQPPGVNTDTKYNMKYSLYYEKNGHKKINSLASDQPG